MRIVVNSDEHITGARGWSRPRTQRRPLIDWGPAADDALSRAPSQPTVAHSHHLPLALAPSPLVNVLSRPRSAIIPLPRSLAHQSSRAGVVVVRLQPWLPSPPPPRSPRPASCTGRSPPPPPSAPLPGRSPVCPRCGCPRLRARLRGRRPPRRRR